MGARFVSAVMCWCVCEGGGGEGRGRGRGGGRERERGRERKRERERNGTEGEREREREMKRERERETGGRDRGREEGVRESVWGGWVERGRVGARSGGNVRARRTSVSKHDKYIKRCCGISARPEPSISLHKTRYFSLCCGEFALMLSKE